MSDFYRAMRARDPRFDGKFFVGVKTTGVYCRPICPAKPKRENVEFFPDAASAEIAGYRPCLRCRPECAPLSPAWWGKKAVVQRALKLIAKNEYHHVSAGQFAARLGVSARHLGRLFKEEIGKTPKQIADENRLNFARKLIVETRIPIMKVARSAGFASLRRFNGAFQHRFGRAPSKLRKMRANAAGAGQVELELSFRPPLDWLSLVQFYRTHPIPGVESVTGDVFERVFRIGDEVGHFTARIPANAARVRLTIVIADPRHLLEIVSRVRRMFDLDSDPMLIADSFAQSPLLSRLHRRFPGLRVPGGWDPFETAICSILGQLVSAAQRVNLVAQLVAAYGEQVAHPLTGAACYLFPGPEKLAESDLLKVRTTPGRKEAIREFSRRVLSGSISLSEAQDPLSFRKALLETRGIGPWSAEYISLRAIGDTDAFPRTDLILKRVLEKHPNLDFQSIKPWRAYAAIYLWKAFARTLSRKRRSAGPIIVLQRDGVAGGHAQAGGQRHRAGGDPLGKGESRAAPARIRQARSGAPDLARGRATAR
jgi:AraC family transcriptional regulator of adaptative response / DNA-3-methyladenine glycosylase II